MENSEEIFKIEVERWFSEKGDVYRRLNYPELNKDSLVIDLGGYIGNFTESIYSKYNCNVMLFEPVLGFYNICDYKFKENNKINVYNFGLSGESRQCSINLFFDSSTEFLSDDTVSSEIVSLLNIKEFIENNNIDSVDLLKINIEGGEYELMEYIVSDPDLIRKIKNIQIQYHIFIENHKERRNNINNKLSNTHTRTWNYEWVWENWEIKK